MSIGIEYIKSLRLQDGLKTSVVKKYGGKTRNKKPVYQKCFFKNIYSLLGDHLKRFTFLYKYLVLKWED
jgi:hypothetical protein